MDHGNHDFYSLFTHYWWLLFPLASGLWGWFDTWTRHKRAERGLELLKSYIDQGKEPPPALLEFLQKPVERERDRSGYGWVPVFLFAAITAGLVMFALMPGEWDHRQHMAFVFAALITGGLCLGLLVSQLTRRDRLPPQ
jgi:hypothetical protein